MSAKRTQRPLGIPAHLHTHVTHSFAPSRMVRFEEGVYSIDEAARMTGLTPTQVSKRVQYARKRNQRCALASITPSHKEESA